MESTTTGLEGGQERPVETFTVTVFDRKWFTFEKADHAVDFAGGRLYWDNPAFGCFTTFKSYPHHVFMHDSIVGAVVYMGQPPEHRKGINFRFQGKSVLEMIEDMQATARISERAAIELRGAVKECLTAQAVNEAGETTQQDHS